MSIRPISEALYQLVAQDAQFQCGYCRCPQEVLPYRLEVVLQNWRSGLGSDGRVVGHSDFQPAVAGEILKVLLAQEASDDV